MTVNADRYRCFLIGSESLLVECGENLLRQGHEILGVVTSAKKITKWAASKGLRVVDAAGDYRAVLAEQPFDYLFSITYLSIIPDDVLALPVRGAINFHDGPLPRYAGLNTPVWALLNGETDYAVTWHWMTAGVDCGDILIQKPVEIAANDTALTLNTKCFHAGIESFGELVGLLMTGAISPRPQNLDERKYYAKHDRPVAAGGVDFTKSATECETLVRALNHGRYVNPVATAKVRHGGKTFVVTEATVAASSGHAAPGTLVDVADAAITVACGDGALQLRGFTTTCGRAVTPAEFIEQTRAKSGDRFDTLTGDEVVGLTELNKLLAKHEAWWVRRLESLDAAQVPYVAADASSSNPPNFVEARQPLPPGFVQKFGSQAADALVCALAAYLARVGEKTSFDVAYADESLHDALAGLAGWAAPHVPLRLSVDPTETLDASLARHAAEFAAVRKRRTYLHDVLGRYPELHDRTELAVGRALPIAFDVRVNVDTFRPRAGTLLNVVASIEQGMIRWAYDASVVSSAAFATIRSQFANLLAAVVAQPETLQAEIELLTPGEKKLILRDWNSASADYRSDVCVHTLIEEQAARTPEAVAVCFEDRQLTYRQLNERADRLAAHLRGLGVGPDRMVGIHLERSEQLVVAVLATLKAGGAYLPLDPNYPDDRIAFMIEDAAAPVIITERETFDRLPPHKAAVVTIDAHHAAFDERRNVSATCTDVAAHNLAYVIYTSGSTGKPKGVMIEHRNAVNFFAGMDQRLDVDPAGTWLAVTSLSFDIHVLELLWTLSRGFKVIVYRDRNLLPSGEGARRADEGNLAMANVLHSPSSPHPSPLPKGEGAIDFSLFYFSADSEAETDNKYRLLLEGAKWGDAHGFCAVWTPERHFHSFGGLYPNPAVTGAAVAVLTKNVQIRSGSVVLPLHHPVRVAEAWQVVDNLSNGRVGISVAAGWQPNDFLLRPENFKDAKGAMFRDLEIVQRLWRGEKVEFPGATGKSVAVETLPRPIQKELPVWVTTAGNIDTYVAAGRIGANVLTHLLGQSVEDLAPKIAAYREARAAAGFDPAAGIVSLMLHTFVGPNAAQVRNVVRGPLKAYLGTSLNLLKQYAWAFPAFTRPKNADTSQGNEFESLTPDEQDALLEFAFERYYETSGLFGTPDEALAMVDRVKGIGVDEIACLIDFGIATDTVLNHLPHLNEVREKANSYLAASLADARSAEDPRGQAPRLNEDYSLAALFTRHNVTHFQCTPSLARMLLSDDAGRAAVKNVKNFLVGGEALPVDLARDLTNYVGGRVINMYGPTETTVWSTSHVVDDVSGAIPIGKPLANQQVYILDARRKPVPVGVPGELYIAGDGVTRGYLNRPELTADRFVHDPFSSQANARMYRTGDLVRHRGDGVVEFLGRTDHQVKIRGHRIELGEIEARLTEHPHVRQCVVVPRDVAAGDVRLVAYYVADGDAVPEADLRAFVRAKLPEYMAPQHLVVLDALPLTPNGKIDRKALPALDLAATSAPAADYVAPTNDLEQTIANLWQEVLGREQVGVDDNFFDIGGHSLLVVRMHRQLAQAVSVPVALTDLFRFPTIRTLVAHLSGANQGEAAQEGTDRANKRRELQQRRRIVKR